jgi:drug/metabolite transporter (DMT)-like permease
LQRHSPGSLSVFGVSVPVFGVILSALLFHEAITGRLIAGVVAVMVGIVIVTRYQRRAEPLAIEETLEEPVEEMSR